MKRSSIISLLTLCISVGLNASEQALPVGAQSLFQDEPRNSLKVNVQPYAAEASSVKIVTVDDASFSSAWQVRSGEDVRNVEDVELEGFSDIAVEEGGTALIHFWARCTQTIDESGMGRVFVHVRKNGVDFNSSILATVSAGQQWQEFFLPFKFIGSYPENGAVLRLRFGFPGQTVELGGLEVTYYGKTKELSELPRTLFTYAGREADAEWRKEALERIEKIRKRDLQIRVVDASGKPVDAASLSLKQKRSAFQFGTAIPLIRLTAEGRDNEIFREKVLELFEAASPENDLKWPVWLGEWNDLAPYSHQKAIAGLEWLKERGFHLRGHVLVWPGWKNLPQITHELRDAGRAEEILPIIDEHIREMGEVTRDLLPEWDVLNEPYTNHDLMDLFGPEIMVRWFKVAREAFPDAALYFNDFSNHDQVLDAAHVAHFEETFRYLLDNGAPVDGLGLQAHISGQPNDPERVLATLDRYSKASGGLPIRFTEFDIRTEDEELQADYTRDFFILAFSHPDVVGIQLWGFWEGAHWIPLGAMYRKDWSEKPNAAVYKDLVLKQWRTNLCAETGAHGEYTTRAFLGDYELNVEHDGRVVTKTFTLPSGDSPQQVLITLE